MEETVTVMVGINGENDASYDRAFTFNGELRDIFQQVKQHAISINSDNKYLMDISENDEGLPQVEMRTYGDPRSLNMIVFATRKYETHTWRFVGEMI